MTPELKQRLLTFLNGSGHQSGCSYREWLCSQPTCGEFHETPCDCGRDALIAEVEQIPEEVHA